MACSISQGGVTITLECGGKVTSSGMQLGTWAASGTTLIITTTSSGQSSTTTCTKTGG